MASGDFNNLVLRKTTAYNSDGSYIKDGYVFTVSSNGKQNWTPDLRLNNLVLSTFTLSSQLYVASSLFDRTSISSLAVSSLTASSIVAARMFTTDIVTCTMNASTFFFPSVSLQSIYASSMSNDSFLTNDATASTLRVTNLSATNFSFLTLAGSTLTGSTLVSNVLTASTVIMKNGSYSTLTGSSLLSFSLQTVHATYSTLTGSTLSVNTVVSNSTLIGSTVNAVNMTYSTLEGSTLLSNNATVQTILTASTIHAVNIGCSTLSANTVVISSTLAVSSLSGSTMVISTINTVGITSGSIEFSTLIGSTIGANVLTVNSTITTSSLNAVNLTYSTLQGNAIQALTIIASTVTGSTINFANLSFSTLVASTMTANVMFPLSLQGSTVNVSSLLTASYVGIGTTAADYPLTVSNTITGAMELNRASTTNNFYGAGTVYTVTDPANNQFKGTYAYAFGGARTLAIASQSQADGYYAIDVANAGLFGSDTAGAATGATFYMDSIKTYFQNTALGVGTTSPGWPLTVAKDMPFAAMMSNPLDAALVIKGQNNIGTLKIGTYFTGASFGAAIQSSQFSTGVDAPSALLLNQLGGNVGIGTNNPTALLSIYSGSSNTVALSVTTSGTGLGSGIQFVNTTPSTGRNYGIYSGSDGLLHLNDTTAATDRMTIGSTGVTILDNLSLTGASSIFYKYGPTVGYYVDIQGGSATNSPLIEFFAGGVRRAYLGNASITSMEIYCQNGANLNFLTEGSNRMMIATSGNVGINTTTPATPLDVNGNVRAITGFGTNTGSLVGLTQTVTPIHVFRGMMAQLTVTGVNVANSAIFTYMGIVQSIGAGVVALTPTITTIVSNGITASISGGSTPTISLATTAAVTANVSWNIMYITCPVYASANTFTPGF